MNTDETRMNNKARSASKGLTPSLALRASYPCSIRVHPWLILASREEMPS
jgi:hypothetical protein